ncbi:hypothetical protein JI749_11005 [Devosia oryziradicis]|uniref:Uncharacterized protein n=1 Tax=Devosia oryziradicis TaxID=2801335 RepID=A0ABX7BSL9_9HYPH|nr:hypothetical protein [Devosia oryziradicis]QQR34908.1 hypothetical protein JI749_11005 [Devosia oryziradicis]
MRITIALPLLLALAMPAFAQSTSIDLTDNVPGATGVTYLDLARAIAPDLEASDGLYGGTLAMAVRNLVFAEDPPVSHLPLSFYSASAVAFTSGGAELVALLLDADAETTGALGASVLAIFDPAHPEAPVDIADVASDQHTSFDEAALLPLGTGDDALVVSSSHFNSSQGYRNTSVLAMLDGKLVELASIFTLNESYCGLEREQIPALAPVPAAGTDRWAPFTVTVTETTSLETAECDLPGVTAGTRAASATFSWNAATGGYEPDSTALEDLMAETEARF